MTIRTYQQPGGYKLVVYASSDELTIFEKDFLRYPKGNEDLLMIIQTPYGEKSFSAYKYIFPNSSTRLLMMHEIVPDCIIGFVDNYFINDAIYMGFDFTLLPNPTKEELKLAYAPCNSTILDYECFANQDALV